MTCSDVEHLLDAYVDRELPEPELSRVRGHLEICGTCSGLLADRLSLGRAVRSVPYYRAPQQLRDRLEAATPAHVQYRAWPALVRMAALIMIAATAGALVVSVMMARDRTAAAGIASAEEMVDGHVRALMGDHLFDVESSDQHTVKPWFLGKIDFSPPVVDLADAGFPLVGGRLEYVHGRAAAALVYRRRQHTINLFVWPEPGDAPRDESRSIRGFQLRRWRGAGMVFWAVSDLNGEELAQFERLLRR